MITTLKIEKTVYGGDGLGHLGDGRVVFVPGAYTGETVRAEIKEERKGFVKARLVEIDTPSPERRDAADDMLKTPGIVYGDLTLAGEIQEKCGQISEFLQRSRIEHPAVISPRATEGDDGLHYRNKIVYHFEKQKGDWAIGYRAGLENSVVDMTSDPLACPAINAELGAIRSKVKMLLGQGSINVRRSIEAKRDVTIRWTERTGVCWWLGKSADGQVLREFTAGHIFDVPADGFYQVNPKVGDELVKRVVRRIMTEPCDELVDLYCGVGVFGICGASEMKRAHLTGIESGRRAVEFARRNAKLAGLEDATFSALEIGRNLRQIKVPQDATVIIDPPRGGLEKGVAQFLARGMARRIYYVSCDPATLMRDLKTLSGAYRINYVEWFNMFPRTARFETLVELIRR